MGAFFSPSIKQRLRSKEMVNHEPYCDDSGEMDAISEGVPYSKRIVPFSFIGEAEDKFI